MTRRRHIFMLLPLLCAFFVPRAWSGSSLDGSVLRSFPENISELSYADLATARSYPWFAQFQQQTLPVPFMQVENFLDSAGLTYDTQVTSMAWAMGPANATDPDGARKSAPAGEQFVAVALGNFDLDAMTMAFEKMQVPTLKVGGATLYACGSSRSDLYVVLLDSDMIAFGEPALLHRWLDVRQGAAHGLYLNDSLFPLIRKVNGQGVFWAVITGAKVRERLRQFLPAATDFPEAAVPLKEVSALTASISGKDGIDTALILQTPATLTAAVLSQVLEIGLLARAHQEKDVDANIASLLDGIHVGADGADVDVSFSLTNAQVMALIADNILRPQP